jgi:hypothetical protein
MGGKAKIGAAAGGHGVDTFFIHLHSIPFEK